MQSALTNLRHDAGAYDAVLRESIGAGDYILNTPKNNCEACYYTDPRIRMGGTGNAVCSGHLIDVDSELLNLNRKASRAPANNYIPGTAPFCNVRPLKDCLTLSTEDTRLSNPPCTLRGTGFNRFEDLCSDPQARALVPFDYMISSQQLSKDNHRPIIPNPVNQGPGMPPPNNMQVMYRYAPCSDPQTHIQQPALVGCARYDGR